MPTVSAVTRTGARRSKLLKQHLLSEVPHSHSVDLVRVGPPVNRNDQHLRMNPLPAGRGLVWMRLLRPGYTTRPLIMWTFLSPAVPA